MGNPYTITTKPRDLFAYKSFHLTVICFQIFSLQCDFFLENTATVFHFVFLCSGKTDLGALTLGHFKENLK